MSWYNIDPNDTAALTRNWEEQNAAKSNTAEAGYDIWGMPLPAASAPATAAATTPPAGTSPTDKSAQAIIQGALNEYGLGGLGDRLWQQFLGGAPIEQIMLDLRKTPEYAARFPGMAGLAENGRAVSEAEYISTERSYTQVMRAAGIPSGFYDSPDDFGRFIASDVSPAELNQRVDTYTQAAFRAPPEVREQLASLYGVDQGQLVAFFIDPDRALPMIVRQFEASSRSAVGARTGFGSLNVTEAERLVELGVTDQQAEQGFGALVDARELFTSLDAGEDTIDRGTQLGAAFEGNSVARRKIEERRRRRLAQNEAGGGFAGGERGLTGLGSVDG